MFGVILWSDLDQQKAVIWCEDHGDLAFYRPNGDGRTFSLDAGDLVQFDVSVERDLRLALNPRLVGEDVCPDLAGVLQRAGGDSTDRKPQPASAEIIPFVSRRDSQCAEPAGSATRHARGFGAC